MGSGNLIGSNFRGALSSFSSSNARTGRKGGNERSRGLKHLTYQELMDRNYKGLCFHYGEKFHALY